jgi:hypothetical protein
VPADQIAQSLAFINWTVLTGIGIGAFAAVVAARFRTEATRGFLAFTALTAAAFGALAAVSNGAVAGPSGTTVPTDPAWDGLRGLAMAAFPVLAAAYAVALARGRRAPLLALPALAVAGLVVVSAAGSWGGGASGGLALAIELLSLAGAAGGVWTAMILGHWYLVTPRLPEAPLVRVARWLLAILLLQLGLFVAWIGIGAGPAGEPGFGALVGPWALFVWLRLVVGLIFPIVVAAAAVQTARSRSMESATGLLYIDVGTIAAGTILAAGLYFGAGILV